MLFKVTAAAALAATVAAAPLEERASCPKIHVFGARETTAPVGYGSSATFVNAIVNAYPGTTSQAITYPAAGGNSYSSSVQQGTANVGAQVNAYYQQCPSTKLVLVGYSQGSEIEDNALCGGGDLNQGVSSTAATISAAARANIKAVIWAGNPRNSPSESSFHVGSCTAGGFSARPSNACAAYASIIRSYCDASDPYCCNGNNAATHNGYGNEYGSQALAFVKSKLG